MKTKNSGSLTGDIWGGLASMLVALPSAIAYGIIVFSPLGSQFGAKGAVAGIFGAIVLGIFASLIGGTKRLISAPAAPGAAILSAFTLKLAASNHYGVESIFLMVILVTILAGAFQFLFGLLGGGKFIKYIPYPVVAGFLSGVAVLIFLSQLPKVLNLPKGYGLFPGILRVDLWNFNSFLIGVVSVAVMFLAPKLTKVIPPAILALAAGMLAYFSISFFNPALLSLANNNMVIGSVESKSDLLQSLLSPWGLLNKMDFSSVQMIFATAVTLSILLSIDTLKTCVILDSLTRSRHNSNRTLIGQGAANILSGVFGGIPGSGCVGPTLVNVNSGGSTRLAGILEGLFALLAFLLLGKLIMWIPFASLAGILLVIAYRMIDKEIFKLLSQKSTILDFLVVVLVVLAAIMSNLLTAAGVGVAFAILLFLRDQIRGHVIKRKLTASQTFSKKTRLPSELEALIEKGNNAIIVELQGALFFGTTDQLFNELDSYVSKCKYIVLDFKWVRSIDFTASRMLKQIAEHISENRGILILSSLTANLTTGEMSKKYLEEAGLFSAAHLNIKTFDVLDDALEWIEDNNLLEANMGADAEDKPVDIAEIHLFSGLSADEISLLRKCVKEKKFSDGQKIFSKDDSGGEMFFIRKGQVKIMLPLSGENVYHHISTFPRGNFFGDMAFLDNEPRSADAVAEGEVDVYVMSRDDFNKLTSEDPKLAATVFERLAYVLAVRLRHTNMEMQALEDA